ncbi:PleD family two-component system response regulator [Marinitoga arctica]
MKKILIKKILIIDDSVSWREFLNSKLTTLGYDVEIASDGLNGLNKFFEFLPDIVVTDYIMPQMNGIHLCRFIRSYNSFSNVGIIVLTGANESINEFWAKKSGANLFLRKNLPPEKLITKLDNFIKNNNFSIEWSKEFYKFRVNPFIELVDILEESLKMEVLRSTILDLIDYTSDEEYVIKNLHNLFKEFFKFDGLHILLLSTSFGRIYSFSKNKYSQKNMKNFLLKFSIKPTSPTEWIFKGNFNHESDINPEDYMFFNVIHENIELGVIVFEKIYNKNNLIYYMNVLNKAISILFKALNNFIDYRDASERDGLTGLYNKKTIEEKLKDLITTFKRKNFEISIAMIDIDDFKSINDTYGHIVGDSVLKIFSNILTEELRENDFIGRYGGEEFLAIMPATNCEEAKIALQRALDKINNYNWSSIGIKGKITFSAGICCDFKNKSVTDFINDADNFLYIAKNKGKNIIITGEELL